MLVLSGGSDNTLTQASIKAVLQRVLLTDCTIALLGLDEQDQTLPLAAYFDRTTIAYRSALALKLSAGNVGQARELATRWEHQLASLDARSMARVPLWPGEAAIATQWQVRSDTQGWLIFVLPDVAIWEWLRHLAQLSPPPRSPSIPVISIPSMALPLADRLQLSDVLLGRRGRSRMV